MYYQDHPRSWASKEDEEIRGQVWRSCRGGNAMTREPQPKSWRDSASNTESIMTAAVNVAKWTTPFRH